MEKFRNVVWLDLVAHDGPDAVLQPNEVTPPDAFGTADDAANLIYDEQTDMVFTLLADPWSPTKAVWETLEQYEPGEL